MFQINLESPTLRGFSVKTTESENWVGTSIEWRYKSPSCLLDLADIIPFKPFSPNSSHIIPQEQYRMFTNVKSTIRHITPADVRGRQLLKVVYVVLEPQYQSSISAAVNAINDHNPKIAIEH